MTQDHIDYGQVLLDLNTDGVGHIRLNRPNAANAMTVPLLKALHTAIMRCQSERTLRAVVLSGEGANFCAGGDVRELGSQGKNLPRYLREGTAWLHTSISALVQMDVPVIAAVQGFAAGGGGFGLVCAADFVIAGESAQFMSGAARIGMPPDAGVTVILPQLVGLRKAMEILLVNPTLSAAEALDAGILTKVVSDAAVLDEALTLGRTLARSAPRGMAATKRLVWGGLGTAVEARLPEEARTITDLAGLDDPKEGIAAVIERRPPTFTGH